MWNTTCQVEDDGAPSHLHRLAFSILPHRDRPSPAGTKREWIECNCCQAKPCVFGCENTEQVQKFIFTFVFSSALLSSSRRRSRSSISCWRARCLRSCSSSLRNRSWYSLSSSSRCSCSRRSRSSRSGKNRGQQMLWRARAPYCVCRQSVVLGDRFQIWHDAFYKNMG